VCIFNNTFFLYTVPKEEYQFIVNATQYKFDVDVSAPVGIVLFTITASTRNTSFLRSNIDLYTGFL